MFRVKICGIRLLEDALEVAEAGGDAVGFNFYPGTTRYLTPEAARAIASRLPATVHKIGVFVNEPPESVARICQLVDLDCVQLHGDETPASLTELPRSIPVVRAFRLQTGGLAAPLEYLRACDDWGRRPDAVLVDAHAVGAYGGTGRTVNWHELAAQLPQLGATPLFLAGGLTPENVRSAIETVRPAGVDAASGVEKSPGVKDPERVHRFIREANAALDRFSS